MAKKRVIESEEEAYTRSQLELKEQNLFQLMNLSVHFISSVVHEMYTCMEFQVHSLHLYSL